VNVISLNYEPLGAVTLHFQQKIADLGRRFSGFTRMNPVRASTVAELNSIRDSLWPCSTQHMLIRVGGVGDGGYLLPDDLQGISHLFSPGIANNWSFELEIRRITGAKVHLIDVCDTDDSCPFPVEKGYLGGFSTNEQVGINDWLASHLDENDAQDDFLLQMDVEGSEYQILAGLERAYLSRFRVIVVEFHRLDLLASADWLAYVFRPVFERLLEQFTVVHAHPNNTGRSINISGVEFPELLEVTFLRNDRVDSTKPVKSLPNVLDVDNDSKSLPISFKGHA